MPNSALTPLIDRLASGEDLAPDDAAAALGEIMEGRSSDAETAAFLIALRTKGESIDEVVGLVRTMRSLAAQVRVGREDLLDTAGTGGGRPSFNVSTTAAFVAAGAGCPVAKHGNRSATGTSGSADLLEALGARIDLEPAAVAECIDRIGFGFMFAPAHHQAMRYVIGVRRELAVRTVFNILGPLSNPAGASRQLIGVSDPRALPTVAGALGALGGQRALVVSSADGYDEISVSAPTQAFELRDGQLSELTIEPEELGLDRVADGAFSAGTPEQNAAITRAVLSGAAGPERTVVLANAGAAIYLAGEADSISSGVTKAAETIDSGAAADLLERYLAVSGELAPR